MIINTDAIVLHRMKYKNSSLIARLFTKDEGKISIIVNGASKQKGNLFGVIEPPNIIKLNYYKRKVGSLQTCKEASFISNNLDIKKDIMKLSISLAIVEIIDKTLHENDMNVHIYNLADKTLNTLNTTNLNPQLILAFFLLHITHHLGFMPELQESGNVTEVPKKIKIILAELNSYTMDNLCDMENDNLNFLDIITFLEDYITEHLRLNKKIQSLNMIREIVHG